MSDTNEDAQKLANITIKNRERQARYYLKHKQGILDKMKISREQLKELNAIPEPAPIIPSNFTLDMIISSPWFSFSRRDRNGSWYLYH